MILHKRRFFAGVYAAFFIVPLLLCGCGGSGSTSSSNPVSPPTPPYTPPAGSFTGLPFTGKVMAGTAPVIDASVQVYTVGTSGNGSAPTQLFSTAFTTDANGAFTVSSSYTCPESSSVLYIVATGGHASASGTANAGIVLMTSPGTCASISGNPSFVLNELTTVAAAYAFSQFLSAGASLGSTSTNSSGMELAAATFANLVNPISGTAPSVAFPSTGVAPVARLNTLANVLHACIIAGASSNACTALYSATAVSGTTPANIFDALINVAHNPGLSTAALYTLSAGSTAYAPVLAKAPSDWTLAAAYTGGGMQDPTAVTIDSTGRVWVANYFSVASLFTNTGVPVFPNGVTGYNLYESYSAAVDANDNVWITNEELPPGVAGNSLGSITVLTASGSSMTGTVLSAGGIDFPSSIVFDNTNVAWIVNYGDQHITQLSSSGSPLSGNDGYSSSQLNFPVAVAVDSRRNGYVANQQGDTVTKVSPDGSTFTSYASSSAPTGVAVDGADNVWVTDIYSNSVTLIGSDGTIRSGTGFTGGGLSHPQDIAIDGAGNAWITNYFGAGITELASASSTAPGTPRSPSTGWGTDANISDAFGLAIDASGNVWAASTNNNTLVELIGIAAPVKTPLLGPVRQP